MSEEMLPKAGSRTGNDRRRRPHGEAWLARPSEGAAVGKLPRLTLVVAIVTPPRKGPLSAGGGLIARTRSISGAENAACFANPLHQVAAS